MEAFEKIQNGEPGHELIDGDDDPVGGPFRMTHNVRHKTVICKTRDAPVFGKGRLALVAGESTTGTDNSSAGTGTKNNSQTGPAAKATGKRTHESSSSESTQSDEESESPDHVPATKRAKAEASPMKSPNLSDKEEKIVDSFLDFCATDKFTMPSKQYDYGPPSFMTRQEHEAFLRHVADSFFKTRGATPLPQCSIKVVRAMSSHAHSRVTSHFEKKK